MDISIHAKLLNGSRQEKWLWRGLGLFVGEARDWSRFSVVDPVGVGGRSTE